ncbi:MAG TPA: hypothetical protein VE090_00280 [Methylomirabilota bacterium]|nr:hypothetical protein [Methylomirabilota bacterium]
MSVEQRNPLQGKLGPRFGQAVAGETYIDTPERQIYLDKKPAEGPYGFIDFHRQYGLKQEDKTYVDKVAAHQKTHPADNVVTISIRELHPDRVQALATENNLVSSPDGHIRVNYYLFDNDDDGDRLVKYVKTYCKKGWDTSSNRLGEGIREVGEKDIETVNTLLTALEDKEKRFRESPDVSVPALVTVRLKVMEGPTPEGYIPVKIDPSDK